MASRIYFSTYFWSMLGYIPTKSPTYAEALHSATNLSSYLIGSMNSSTLSIHHTLFGLPYSRHCTPFFSVMHTYFSVCTNASPTPAILPSRLPSFVASCFLVPTNPSEVSLLRLVNAINIWHLWGGGGAGVVGVLGPAESAPPPPWR